MHSWSNSAFEKGRRKRSELPLPPPALNADGARLSLRILSTLKLTCRANFSPKREFGEDSAAVYPVIVCPLSGASVDLVGLS